MMAASATLGAPPSPAACSAGRARPLFGQVWSSLGGWKKATAFALKELGARYPKGKRRRSWKRKARDLLTCGEFAEILVCRGCSGPLRESATVRVGCGLRVCPLCARRRATLLRQRLGRRFAAHRPAGMGLYLLTFTMRYDPASTEDLSIDGLRRRKALIRAGWSHVWRRYLKHRAHAAVCATEVSPRGAVHAHVLYHGRFPDIVTVRELWLDKVPDSPQVNARYVHSPATAILEVAKYVTKGASPARARVLCGGTAAFTHPELAARVEVAFAGNRLVECYGAWRGVDDDEDEPRETYGRAPCLLCGLVGEWRWVSLRTRDLAARLGPGFKPRFARAISLLNTS